MIRAFFDYGEKRLLPALLARRVRRDHEAVRDLFVAQGRVLAMRLESGQPVQGSGPQYPRVVHDRRFVRSSWLPAASVQSRQ